MLIVDGLSVSVEGKEILSNISLHIKPGELHVLMGPNGSGKSTLGLAIAGDQSLKCQVKSLKIDGKDISQMKPVERARAGLFLGFQQPITVPGVNFVNFLRQAHGKLGPMEFYEKLLQTAQTLEIPEDFLSRNINEEFSGGEKKKMELLQALILKPKYAILDEPDTGTDVDSLKLIARAIVKLQKMSAGILLITHYQRLIKYLKPDWVYLLVSGKIVKSGGMELIEMVEKEGYKSLRPI